MSLIQNIINESNFEIVRSRIASILADELDNQKTLNEIALVEEEAKPSPDPTTIAALELNISAIPYKIWEERFKRPQPEEYEETPVINVMFANAPLNTLQSVSTQDADNTYVIEVYSGNREPGTESPVNEGDSLAAIKLQRCLAIIRSILMFPEYQRLGFDVAPYFIGKVSANGIQIAQPNGGNENTNNLIYGKINLTVKVSEGVEQITGITLALSETTVKLNDTEKGYFWTNESN